MHFKAVVPSARYSGLGSSNRGVFDAPCPAAADVPAVVKVLMPPEHIDLGLLPSSSVPSSLTYWKREFLFYRANLLGGDCGPLRPPRVLHLEERDDGAKWIWLERISEPASAWSAEDYYSVASHLGEFSARWFARIPALAWLSRDWIPQWFLTTSARVLKTLHAGRAQDPTIDYSNQARLLEGLLRRRLTLFGELRAAPSTLCHMDSNRYNLLRETETSTVGIDWEFVGAGAVGADASQLFASSALRLALPSTELGRYQNAILEGYLHGLSAAGCPAHITDAVPRIYSLCTVMRWGAAHLFWLDRVEDVRWREHLERHWWRQSMQEIRSDLHRLTLFFTDLVQRELRG